MHIPWFFLTLSTPVTYALLLLLARWIGSTQLTQVTFFNWVAGASMGNIAANMIVATTPAEWTVSGFTLILFTICSVAAAWLAMKSRAFRKTAGGQPLVLIHHGHILHSHLQKARLNLDDVLMLLREQGYFSLHDVQFAILEPSGNLSVLEHITSTDRVQGGTEQAVARLAPPPAQSIKVRQEATGSAEVALATKPSVRRGEPLLDLILDGQVDFAALERAGVTREWLEQEWMRNGAKFQDEILYFGIAPNGEPIVELKRM
ncbi:YetF domain-containing protein [Alicyclobacillus sp. SP_1]|uniref:YetF domain-containing protein n=1 Tax=Alicyclobacillus sp. SP_1 TaxID=2942475 RepID=UPI0021577A16|nr:YetF domain-containing protein [Alicyclobacillus sp. SP_1]